MESCYLLFTILLKFCLIQNQLSSRFKNRTKNHSLNIHDLSFFNKKNLKFEQSKSLHLFVIITFHIGLIQCR